MPKRKDSVSVLPTNGGALMTRPSADRAGLSNYVWKQDWRRDLDQEIRREGHDLFRPNVEAPLGNQPYPQSQPLRGQPVTFDSATDKVAMTGIILFNVLDGTRVRFSGGTMPLPLGSGTIYYVVSVTTTDFKVALTAGGAAINITSNGAGVLMDTVDPLAIIAPEAINLVHLARRPNGQIAVIVGTPTTLYRFMAKMEPYFEVFSDEAYFEGTGPDAYIDEGAAGAGDDFFTGGGGTNTTYFVTTGEGTPYFEEETGHWQVIGSGFSKLGKRWEAVNINGYAVFNNGYDLPVTFRVEESVVIPIYELRESGVAFVGTIAETHGVLMLMDIAQIKEELLEANFAHIDSGDIQASQVGSQFSQPFTATAEAAEQGYAVRFDGVDDLITIPHSGSLDIVGISTITVEAWVKTRFEDPAPADRLIAQKGLSWSLALSGKKLLFHVRGTSVTSILGGPTDLGDEQWWHVAATYDGTNQRLYVNGVLEATMAAAVGTIAGNANPVRFAVPEGGTGITGNLKGDLAEVRLWNVARTEAQILAGMNYVATPQAGLVGIWAMNEGSGLTAADSSGNGNTGTLTNGPTWIASTAPTDSTVKISPLAAAAGGLTRVGATATFQTVTAHPFTTGQVVNISGATGAEYNGDFTITIIDFDRFTYAVAGAPATPDPGTPVARRAYFEAGMVGKRIEFMNGLNGPITAFVDSTTVRVGMSAASLVGYHYLFYIIEPATDYLVTSSLNFFTAEMVGRNLFWDSGAERLITGYVSATEVRVDRHLPIALGYFQLENTEAYDAFGLSQSSLSTGTTPGATISTEDGALITGDGLEISIGDSSYQILTFSTRTKVNPAYYDRIQYRMLWSGIDEPRRFSAAVPGSIMAGSRQLVLKYPSRSFAIGQSIVITGAGPVGSNLETEIIWIASDRRSISLTGVAETSVTDELVSAADAASLIVGYMDLQDDGSGILKAMDLGGTLVVYKDTSIFLVGYTGLIAAPFQARRVYNEGGEHSGRTPFYRHTLISVNGEFHLYAGRNSFYQFNLASQTPKEFAMAENLSNLFYEQVTLANVEKIFSGNNSLTKEIFIIFPSATTVKGICLDYFTNTASTTGAEYTALATIKRPMEGIALGAVEDWCVMGDTAGRVLLYGKADVPQDLWDGAEAIWHRNGQGYESRLRSGLYGNRYNESDLTAYLLELSTQANPNLALITLNIYGYRNAAENATLLDTITLPMAAFANLVPVFYREHYFQDELVVNGVNDPCRIAARTMELGVVRSRSVIRRVA